MIGSPPPAARYDARALFGTAGMIGLAAGCADATIVAARRSSQGMLGDFPALAWMTPLMYLVCALLAAAMVATPALLTRRASYRAPVFVVLLLCMISVIGQLLPRVHPVALILLALGVAARATGRLATPGERLARTTRRLVPALLGLTALLAVLPAVYRWRLDRAPLAPAPASAPNVLLLILDTVGAGHLGLYGYHRPTTPALERWARRGTTFERAIATSPWTLPSHASLFSGRYPNEIDYSWERPVQPTLPVLAEAYRDAGYATGAFIANLAYLRREHGLDRGFRRYEADVVSPGSFARSAWLTRKIIDARPLRTLAGTDELANRKPARLINRRFLRWLGGDARDRPFFAVLNYYDAHEPYLPPRDVFRRIAGYERRNDLDPLRRYTEATRGTATPDDVRLARDSYDAAIAALDADVGALLDTLDARGTLATTVVIVTSDHGEEFGERGVFYHGHTLYAPVLHVPLLILYPPAVPANTRVPSPVSLRDLAATVLDVAPLAGARAFPGTSLRGAWSGAAASLSPITATVQRGIRIPDRYPGGRADLTSVFADGWHLIRESTGREALFRWPGDEAERADLAATAEGGALLAALRARLPQPDTAR